jgi:ribose 5-phosphate isomerase A
MDLPKTHDQLEREKQIVAEAALGWVRTGMTVGLGTGTTARYFIGFLGEQVRRGTLQVTAVASSRESEEAARQAGLTLTEPRRGLRLDITIDGADEIAPDMSLIKGGGGALLREKVLAQAARYFLVMGDSSKRVQRLGVFPLPVEVIPFAAPWVMDRLQSLGAPDLAIRMARSGEPYLTDQRNYVVDGHFGAILDPRALAAQLKGIPGIVEHGLFLPGGIPDRAEAALVCTGLDIMVLRPGRPAVGLSALRAEGKEAGTSIKPA